MDAQLKLASGKTFNIPERLYLAFEEESSGDSFELSPKRIDDYSEELLVFPHKFSPELVNVSFQLAEYFQSQNEHTKSLLYLGVFAEKKAQILMISGNSEKGLNILMDAMGLEHDVLAYVNPTITRQLTDLLGFQTEIAFSLGALLGSLDSFTSNIDDIRCLLRIAAVVWEPELTAKVQDLGRVTEKLVDVWEDGFPMDRIHGLNDSFQALKEDLFQQADQQNSEKQQHLDLMIQFVDAGLEMLRQEILVSSTARYTSEGLDLELIEYQASQLIGKAERRLRALITEKYKRQFGESWVQHIETKHKSMFDRWRHYRKKDQSSFDVYPQYSPKFLEYALLRDLAELISSQWHLFQPVFDFGYQKRNKAVLNDKIRKIINVRNALAHHRRPPENELLRARVLCTDVLLCLDQAGEGQEEW